MVVGIKSRPETNPQMYDCGLRKTLPNERRRVAKAPGPPAAAFSLSLEPGWVSPSYGVKVPTTVLVWKAAMNGPIEASFLFAEIRMTVDERAAVNEALRARCNT